MLVPAFFLGVGVSSLATLLLPQGPPRDVGVAAWYVVLAVAVVVAVREAGGQPSTVTERMVVVCAALAALGPLTVALMSEGFPLLGFAQLPAWLGMVVLIVTVFQDGPRDHWPVLAGPVAGLVAPALGGLAQALPPLVALAGWTASAVVLLRLRGATPRGAAAGR